MDMQDLHRVRIALPRDKQSWPDQEALDFRYRRFRLAS
jgi:hypothetical protein